MQIRLQQIIPIPLQEKNPTEGSDIWGKQITFTPGERIKITAASGRGKTTYSHFLAGIRKDYSGSIIVNGAPLSSFSSQEMAVWRREQLGVVYQDLRLFPELTIRENIELKKYLAPQPDESFQFEMMAEILGIADLLNTKAGICSYGEQQRAAIIRTLSQPFQWLLLDEPFSHLDKKNQQKAIELIQKVMEIKQAGLILLDLEPDNHFSYTQFLQL
ncbi:MAG: ATP-binding cassette domain-containing protein [Chitinophagia bacterium]|nr:ATP-binding cassette domain-containing protein [Chitinophagia bacterium]